ncbi:MAG: hypothetical protein WKF94_03780 [Solirubrobacteraceae bacterium]
MADPISFAAGTLDRAANCRADPAWVHAARADPRALAVIVGPRGVRLAGDGPELVALDGRDGHLLGVRDDGVGLWAVEAGDGDELADLRAADYAGGHAQADDDELEDVRWFDRVQLREAAAADDSAWLLLPPRVAIARRLVDAWLADG